jgi:endonuclease I
MTRTIRGVVTVSLPVLTFLLSCSLAAVEAQNSTNSTVTSNITSWSGCSADEYYADLLSNVGPPSSWTREQVKELIISTHRNVLPGTAESGDGDDIYSALASLDENPNRTDQVLLVYSGIGMSKDPAGTPESWQPERLWPIERGANFGTAANTDVYNCRAADVSVIIQKRGDSLLDRLPLFFGECGTVENIENCTIPATIETAPDTAQDAKIWLPDTVNRGDIARSMFYVQMRYEMELGFFLADCPPFLDNEYGYLSPLLDWHAEDPVTDLEIARNDQACERWQGNRNPFIDYPELVEQFFGTPDVIQEGTYTFSRCADATQTPSATPNACSNFVKAGDIYTFLTNSDDPQSMIFYTLVDIPAVIGSLFVTDNAYNGVELLNTEGTVEVGNSLHSLHFVLRSHSYG